MNAFRISNAQIKIVLTLRGILKWEMKQIKNKK